MHRTVSLDYGVVLEGEVVLELDSGETRTMKRGDVAIKRYQPRLEEPQLHQLGAHDVRFAGVEACCDGREGAWRGLWRGYGRRACFWQEVIVLLLKALCSNESFQF